MKECGLTICYFAEPKNCDKLLQRRDALEKQLQRMDAELCLLEVNSEINAGYGNETTLQMT